jgi:formylglycine-generating enzyme required for sulfatase activity
MKVILLILSVILILNSCAYDKSPVTGWDYNDPKNGGFQKAPFIEQEIGPGLILITGGDLVIQLDGKTAKQELTVKIPSFYMDETEVSNKDWCEYLYWIERTFGQSFPTLYYNSLPDTTCWRDEVGDFQGRQLNYLRHPAYANYPVVGIDWMQANNFCSWRTDRVNEFILIREGILVVNPYQQNEPFTTDSYLAGQYELGVNLFGQLSDLDPSKSRYNPSNGLVETDEFVTRNVRYEDGILLPNYRLPTEAEWEYAASNPVTLDSKQNKKIRKDWKKDRMFVAYNTSWLQENTVFQGVGDITNPVNSYLPNDYGLYNMHANVGEWVADVYQVRTKDNVQMFAPLASNDQIKIREYSSEGSQLEKYDEVIYDVKELIKFFDFFESEVRNRTELDSMQNDLFGYIHSYLQDANNYLKNDNSIGASRAIRIIVDDLLYHYESDQKTFYSSDDFINNEIYFEITRGFSHFVLFHPGQLPERDQTPEESIRRRNVNNNNLWVSDYDEKLDSLSEVNESRVVKGRSFVNLTDSVNIHYRAGLNKYESACYIGFRCAMDRLGAPVGLGKR